MTCEDGAAFVAVLDADGAAVAYDTPGRTSIARRSLLVGKHLVGACGALRHAAKFGNTPSIAS